MTEHDDELAAERQENQNRERATREIADYAMLTGNMRDANPYDVVDSILLGMEEGDATSDASADVDKGIDAPLIDDAEVVTRRWLAGIEAVRDRTSMVEPTAEFLDDRDMENATLALLRLEGHWDGAIEVEQQIPVVAHMLEADGYVVEIIDRRSQLAKPVSRIVPGTTSAPGYVAMARKRCMLVAENPRLPIDHPRRVLELDKTAWFGMSIGALGELESSAAQKEAMLIITCSQLLYEVPLDWGRLASPDESGIAPDRILDLTLDQLAHFLRVEANAEDHARFAQIVAGSRRRGVPDKMVMMGLLNPQFLSRFWSPMSTNALEEYISASTPPPFGTADMEVTQRTPYLLTPAAAIYYIAGHEGGRPGRPGLDVKSLIKKR